MTDRLTAALVAVASLAVGCDNDCDFFERCNGDVREVCGDGPDQAFHRRIHREPCETPNTICVELDDDHAACVSSPKTTCDDGFERHCDQGVLIVCSSPIGYTDRSAEPPRYLVGVDCDADDRTCVDYGDDASCVESKP